MPERIERLKCPAKVEWPPFLDNIPFDFSSASKYLRMGLPSGYRQMINFDDGFLLSVPRNITANLDIDVTISFYENPSIKKTLTLNAMIKGRWYPVKTYVTISLDQIRYINKYKKYLSDYAAYREWFDSL